jgi:hypothetical protein
VRASVEGRRPRLPRVAGDDGPAAGPGQGQDRAARTLRARADAPAERLDGPARRTQFNEGYATPPATPRVPRAVPRGDPSRAALRELLPRRARWKGPRLDAPPRLAPGRPDAQGEIATLEEQDRSLWDREQIAGGRAAGGGAAARPGSTRCRLPLPRCTRRRRSGGDDWPQTRRSMVSCPPASSPVVALNHAAAVAMGLTLDRGLSLIRGTRGGRRAIGHTRCRPRRRTSCARRAAAGRGGLRTSATTRHPRRRAPLPRAPAGGSPSPG